MSSPAPVPRWRLRRGADGLRLDRLRSFGSEQFTWADLFRAPHGARAAYQRAVDTADSELSPPASLNLGILLARHSDIKGARAALEVAIHSDHRQASQWGSYYLGVLLTEQRDAKGALAAFQAAVDGDDAEASRLAANAMASLGKRQS